MPDEDENNPEGQENDEKPISKEDYDALVNDKKQLEDDLKKLKNKDRNFEALRKKQLGDLSDEERKQLLGDKIEELESKQKEYRQSQIKERYDDALDIFAGEDKDLREKIEHHYNRLSDEAVTLKEITSKMKDAYNLARPGIVPVDPINKASAYFRGVEPRVESKRFSDTEKGKQLFKDLGMDDMDTSVRGLRVKESNKE